MEIDGEKHAPSPSVSFESDSAYSVDSGQELGAEKHLLDKAHMNNACDDHAKGAAWEHLECPVISFAGTSTLKIPVLNKIVRNTTPKQSFSGNQNLDFTKSS